MHNIEKGPLIWTDEEGNTFPLPRMEARIKKVEEDPLDWKMSGDLLGTRYEMVQYLRTLPMEVAVSVNIINGVPVNYCVCAIGTRTELSTNAVIYNVIQAALLSNATSVILLHNHPQQADARPSYEDLVDSYCIIHILNLMGITLLDHMIVGSETVFSCENFLPEYFELTEGEWNEIAQLMPQTEEEYYSTIEERVRAKKEQLLAELTEQME